MSTPVAPPGERVILSPGLYVAEITPGCDRVRVPDDPTVPPPLRGVTFKRTQARDEEFDWPVFRREARQL